MQFAVPGSTKSWRNSLRLTCSYFVSRNLFNKDVENAAEDVEIVFILHLYSFLV